jgi:hypothetical protein
MDRPWVDNFSDPGGLSKSQDTQLLGINCYKQLNLKA